VSKKPIEVNGSKKANTELRGAEMSTKFESQSWLLRGQTNSRSPAQISPLPELVETLTGDFQLRWENARASGHWGGKAMGMEILTVDTGVLKAVVLPDRGMGVWKCWCDETEFGWQSPVDGPVHPSLVPVGDASGIGWLEGFDELLVRCGLHSNGAPEFTDNGQVKYPLHGRIANLPASRLEIAVDTREGTLDVIGSVTEARFLVYSLQLQTRMRFRAGSSVIEITDTVTNPGSQTVSMQLLYHINIGQPVVEAGSRVYASPKAICPRDAKAAKGVEGWDVCEGPESGFEEQVYFMQAASDSTHWSEAMIASASQCSGLSVQFCTRTLPYFNLWKNTATVEDGYVVGLEPATGFPNPKSFEEKQKRVVMLAGGESRVFRLKLEPLATSEKVESAIKRIVERRTTPGVIHSEPQVGWCF
jgi:hypothetical protein